MIVQYNFKYTGDVQIFAIPATGYYQLEVWGAQGGDCNGNVGGYGGYSKGIIHLIAGQVLNIYIGQHGASIPVGKAWDGGNSWNGGGAGICCGGSGGGATDMRLGGTALGDRIIVGGGGGGASGDNPVGPGGYGGGMTGGTNHAGSIASQTGGYALGQGASSSNRDNAGGGGGYYGGFGGVGETGGWGGGGSGYIGTLKDSLMQNGSITHYTGNGKAIISYRTRNIVVLYKDGKYYMPNKNTFNIHTKSFRDVTIEEIISMIDDYNYTYDISTLDSSFTLNEEIFYPRDIINFSEYKLCVVTDDKPIKINISYTPSSKALPNTTLKIKDKYTPLEDNILNPYLNIEAINKSGITYNLNYDHRNNVTDRISNIIDTEVLKGNFYLSFKFNAPSTMLSSVTLYENKNISHEKIKDDNLKISNDYENTFVTFKKEFNKILVNKITKQYFKYYNNTLDKF